MMEKIHLPDGTATSRLGVGCAALRGGWGTGESLRLLSAAFDAGYRHYDVAPVYGLGLAEDVLGAFLKSRRGEITIATKLGLARPGSPGLKSITRSIAKPLLSRLPGLRRRMAGRAYRMTRKKLLMVTDLRASLAESLRRLGMAHVDILLLHEFTVDDINDEVLRFLEDVQRDGLASQFGVGSRREDALAVARAFSGRLPIIQTNWSALDAPLDLPPGLFSVTHGAVRPVAEMAGRLATDPVRQRQMSAAVGADLADQETLAATMLGAALTRNRNGIVLLASSRAERLAAYARAANAPDFVAAGEKLIRVLAADRTGL